jgi:aspartate/methionine/tyrosine aminotransferase
VSLLQLLIRRSLHFLVLIILLESAMYARVLIITHVYQIVLTTLSKPVDTLKEIARFCSRHNLHLISDEIYANSTFINPFFPEAIRFRSILSTDMEGIMDTKLIHVIYGMSKDFCANGLRLGVIQTRNNDLHEAASSIK